MPINTPVDEPSEYEDMFNEAMKNINKKANKKNLDLSQVGEEVNKSDKTEPSNNILVVSEQDNLTHNYFHYFDHFWDARDCQSNAIIRMPKTNQENINYWISYQGYITVYYGYNIKSEFKDGEKFYDNKELSPVFKGEIGHVKEYYNQIEIQIVGIGKRFKQKIPQEFREAFIYNQNVRDAFQAICEFLGVKYICPPQTESTEDEEDTNSMSADGNENNVSDKVNTENKMASVAKDKVDKANKKKKNTKKKSTKKKNTKSTKKKNNTTNNVNSISDINASTQSDAANGENEESEDELTDNEEIDTPQDGYSDIAFDGQGYITHGSNVIETSPDMAETLIAMEDHPFEKYTEDETGIVEDIKRLLAGEMFEELHNNIMDYDAITIEPKASSSSEMSAVGGAVGGAATAATNNNQSGEFDYKKYWSEKTQNAKIGLNVNFMDNRPLGNLQKGIYLLR